MAIVIGTNAGFVTTSPTADPAQGVTAQISDRALCTRDTTPNFNEITVTEIGWWCDNATEESNYEVGIYTEGTNTPVTVVGTLSTTNAKGTTAGWKKVTGLNISLSSNTKYWIAVQVDATITTTSIDLSTSGGNGTMRDNTNSTLPDPTWDIGGTYNATYAYPIYALYTYKTNTPYAVLEINGTPVTDSVRIELRDTISYSTSTAEAKIDNYAGKHKTDFNVGDTFVVKLDYSLAPSTVIFNGLVQSVSPTSLAGARDEITVRAEDYTCRLKDAYVSVEVYNNTEISAIVKDLIDKYITGITYTNVNTTTTTLTHITFKETSVLDALIQLAELADYDFYIDTAVDLHFEEKEGTSSGESLTTSNVIYSYFRKSDENMYNSVRVRGGKQLTGTRDDFQIADGGSVLTLTYKPHNTRVTLGSVDGTVQQGAIYELTTEPGSNIHYLVDYDQQKIIFVSGTVAGHDIPGNGTDVFVQYDRSRPVIKYGTNPTSIEAYGLRHKTIVDNAIDDPNQAKDIVRSQLSLYSQPRETGYLKIKGITSLVAGNTIDINLPNQDIDDTYVIQEVIWTIETNSLRSDSILEIRVGDRIKNVVDTLNDLRRKIEALEAAEADEADIYTRLQYSTGSAAVFVNSWYVKTNAIGSSFIVSHPINGKLGSNAGVQAFLGDQRAGVVNVTSGGSWV